jgi:hypothetical protein
MEFDCRKCRNMPNRVVENMNQPYPTRSFHEKILKMSKQPIHRGQ